MFDAHRVIALIGVTANAVPAADTVDLVTRAGPAALLVMALLWLERERKSDRARCDAEHRARDSDFDSLRKEIDAVRAEGARLHSECREELRATVDKVLGIGVIR